MSIYLSASAIKDYLACKQRYYYRRFFPEQAEKTDAMLIGSIVHEIIEKHWDSRDRAMEELDKKDISSLTYNKCWGFINSYFIYFSKIMSPKDIVEKNFKVHYDKDVYLVGKYDRILKTEPYMDVVVDWKTSRYMPNTLENDIQFILYYFSYFKEYKKNAQIVYASLINGRIMYFKPNNRFTSLLYYTIIPEMVDTIKSGKFYRDGLFKYKACNFCVFKEYCYSELENNELVRRDFVNLQG